MIRLDIPGSEALEIEHLILDYNGSIAVNGIVIDGVVEQCARPSFCAPYRKRHSD